MKVILRTPLYELANTLGQINFPDDENRAIDRDFSDRLADGEHWLNIINPGLPSRRRNTRLWIVRFTLGGAARHIGATPRGADAARFADMAAVRFARYRKHNRGLPPDRYNFSAEQVASDIDNCPEASDLLDRIEKHLLAQSVISEAPPEVVRPRKSRGLRGDLLLMHDEIMQALATISRRMDKATVQQPVPFYHPPAIVVPAKDTWEPPYVGDPPPGLVTITCQNKSVDSGQSPT